MHKIENYLLFSQLKSTVTFNRATQQFLKESSLLINNLNTTYIVDAANPKVFPLEDRLYDASWYKNLVMAAQIIENHIYSEVDAKTDYLERLKDSSYVSLENFAKKWNMINLIVSNELQPEDLNQLCERYGTLTCSKKLEDLIESNIFFNMSELNEVSMNPNDYRKHADAIENEALLANDITNFADEQSSGLGADDESSEEWIQDIVGIDDIEVRIVNELVGAHIKDLDSMMNWFKANEGELKSYKMKKHITDRDLEFKSLSRLTDLVKNEITSNKQVINKILTKLPADPRITDCNELLQWADSRIDAIIIHRNFIENSDPEKQALLIKNEIALAKNSLHEMQAKIKAIRDKKPSHPGIHYLEEIIKWVHHKEAKTASLIPVSK